MRIGESATSYSGDDGGTSLKPGLKLNLMKDGRTMESSVVNGKNTRWGPGTSQLGNLRYYRAGNTAAEDCEEMSLRRVIYQSIQRSGKELPGSLSLCLSRDRSIDSCSHRLKLFLGHTTRRDHRQTDRQSVSLLSDQTTTSSQ